MFKSKWILHSIELAKKFIWLMNTLLNKVLGENEKCVIFTYNRTNFLANPIYIHKF